MEKTYIINGKEYVVKDEQQNEPKTYNINGKEYVVKGSQNTNVKNYFKEEENTKNEVNKKEELDKAKSNLASKQEETSSINKEIKDEKSKITNYNTKNNSSAFKTSVTNNNKDLVGGKTIYNEPIGPTKETTNIFEQNAKKTINQQKNKQEELKKQNEELKNNVELKAKEEEYKKAKNEENLARYQYNEAKVNNEEAQTGLKGTATSLLRGVEKGLSFGTRNAYDYKYTDENGTKQMLPSYNDLKQQQTSDNNSGVWKVLDDVAFNIGKQLPSIVTGTQVLYNGEMVLDSMQQSLNKGYSTEKALGFATFEVALEQVTGRLLGYLPGKETGSELSKRITDTLIKNGSTNDLVNSMISNFVGEGAEEFTQEFIETLVTEIIDGKSVEEALDKTFSDETLKQASYSFLVGGISGGFFGALSSKNIDNYTANTGVKFFESEESANNWEQLQNRKQQLLENIENNNVNKNELKNYKKELDNINNSINEYTKNWEERVFEKQNGFKFNQEVYDNNMNTYNRSKQQYEINEDLDEIAEVLIRTNKDLTIQFDDSIEGNGKTNIVNGKTIIRLNPNSDVKNVQFLLAHELTHDFVDKNTMKKLYNVYKNDENFKKSYEELKNKYGNELDEEEFAANYFGALIDKNDTINNLSRENPSLFKKLYSSFIKVFNKITNYGVNSTTQQEMLDRWQEAYRNNKQQLDNTILETNGLRDFDAEEEIKKQEEINNKKKLISERLQKGKEKKKLQRDISNSFEDMANLQYDNYDETINEIRENELRENINNSFEDMANLDANSFVKIDSGKKSLNEMNKMTYEQVREEALKEYDENWGLKEKTLNSDEKYLLVNKFQPKIENESKNKKLTKFKSNNNEFNIYEDVDPTLFHDIFEISRIYTTNGELVDLHPVESDENTTGYKDMTCYLSNDGLQGFAITKDGDLVSVFNADPNKKGFLSAISDVIKNKVKTLDCYNSNSQPLPKIYEKKFNFKVASTMEFNEEYNRDKVMEKHNSPEVVFMVNTNKDVENKYFTKEKYDDAKAHQLEYFDNNKEETRPKNNNILATAKEQKRQREKLKSLSEENKILKEKRDNYIKKVEDLHNEKKELKKETKNISKNILKANEELKNIKKENSKAKEVLNKINEEIVKEKNNKVLKPKEKVVKEKNNKALRVKEKKVSEKETIKDIKNFFEAKKKAKEEVATETKQEETKNKKPKKENNVVTVTTVSTDKIPYRVNNPTFSNLFDTYREGNEIKAYIKGTDTLFKTFTEDDFQTIHDSLNSKRKVLKPITINKTIAEYNNTRNSNIDSETYKAIDKELGTNLSQYLKENNNTLEMAQNMPSNTLSTLKGNNILTNSKSGSIVPKNAKKISAINNEEGNGISYSKSVDENTFMSLEAKQKAVDELNRTYTTTTNVEELDNAALELSRFDNIEDAVNDYLKNKEVSGIQTAKGWLLAGYCAENKKYDSMVKVLNTLRAKNTTTAQALQANMIASRLTPEGMVYYLNNSLSSMRDDLINGEAGYQMKKYALEHKDEFKLNDEDIENIFNLITEYQKKGTTQRQQEIILGKIENIYKDKIPKSIGEKLKSFRIIAMLGNTKTLVRNVSANIAFKPIRALGNAIATKIDERISKKTNQRTTGINDLKTTLEGMKQGVVEAKEDYQLGIDTKGNLINNKFEVSKYGGKAFNDKTVVGKSLNKIASLVNYSLDLGDRPFFQETFNNKLKNLVELNKVDVPTSEMFDIAMDEALEATFQNNSEIVKWVSKARSALNKITPFYNSTNYGFGDLILPLIKTNANLLNTTIKFSPLGYVQAFGELNNMNVDIRNGNTVSLAQQNKVASDLGKATAGSILYAIAYGLAQAGLISGNSDDDKDTKNFLEKTMNKQKYSFKVGNTSFTYDWADPLSTILGVSANVKDKKFKDALTTTFSTVYEQSVLDSLTEIFNSDYAGEKFIEKLLSMPASFYPQALKIIGDLANGDKKETFAKDDVVGNALRYTASRGIFTRNLLPTAKDTLGNDISDKSVVSRLINSIIPSNMKTENKNELIDEIYGVYKSTNDKTIMPITAPYSLKKNEENYVLSIEERTKFQEIAGKEYSKKLNELLKSNTYNNMSDEEKANVLNDISSYSNYYAKKELGYDYSDTKFKSFEKYINDGNSLDSYYKDEKLIKDCYNDKEMNTYYKIKYMGFDYDNYKEYSSKIKEIKDKYSNKGNSNSIKNAKKQEIVKYINGLNLNSNQKLVLYKTLGGYSIKGNETKIFNYINKLDCSKKVKEQLYKNLIG